MTDPAAEQQKAEQRARLAMSNAFQKAVMENTQLRIEIEERDLRIREKDGEIATMKAKMAEAGIDAEEPAPDKPPPAAKPNRRARRAAAKKAPAKAGNGTAEAAT